MMQVIAYAEANTAGRRRVAVPTRKPTRAKNTTFTIAAIFRSRSRLAAVPPDPNTNVGQIANRKFVGGNEIARMMGPASPNIANTATDTSRFARTDMTD